MTTVIKVENLSKQYRLGNVGTGTISHDINRWWHGLRGKDDPYLKIGEENDRTQKGSSNYVWALKDINFEVKQGEVVGIIGRNGAGKSTLLKILSRTTTPTVGHVKIKGRVASLLEVGTGFHPELTGRENVFLNGAIMGMHKQEIKNKFDEIVDFSGVEKYIDTPVKRYSSGMHVRLAFGVAAHLEPEILIVDEVLAVGDVEFQKKAMGKMKDVSNTQGRTVLFVSHNMVAISKLCNKGLVMQNGKLIFNGNISDAVDIYLTNHKSADSKYFNDNKSPDKFHKISTAKDGSADNTTFTFDEPITLSLEVDYSSRIGGTHIGIAVIDKWHKKVFTDTLAINAEQLAKGTSNIEVIIPSGILLSGTYYVDAALFVPNMNDFDYVAEACTFEVEDLVSELAMYSNSDIGSVKVDCQWNFKN